MHTFLLSPLPLFKICFSVITFSLVTRLRSEYSSAMDQAAIYIAQTATRYPPISPIEEKRLIRRIDWILVPMVRFDVLFTPIHVFLPRLHSCRGCLDPPHDMHDTYIRGRYVIN